MPILDANTFEFTSRSPDQTKRIGIRLGNILESGDLICLKGDLGAGKTTLVQGIAYGWGTSDAVTSPTFVLVNHYHRPDSIEMNHLDAYRLNSAMEAELLDLDQLLAEGPLIIEWAERILNALPVEYLWIDMQWVGDEHRHLTFMPSGIRYRQILDTLKQSMIRSL